MIYFGDDNTNDYDHNCVRMKSASNNNRWQCSLLSFQPHNFTSLFSLLIDFSLSSSLPILRQHRGQPSSSKRPSSTVYRVWFGTQLGWCITPTKYVQAESGWLGYWLWMYCYKRRNSSLLQQHNTVIRLLLFTYVALAFTRATNKLSWKSWEDACEVITNLVHSRRSMRMKTTTSIHEGS